MVPACPKLHLMGNTATRYLMQLFVAVEPEAPGNGIPNIFNGFP